MRRLNHFALLVSLIPCAMFAQKPTAHCTAPPRLACVAATSDYAGIVREVSGAACFVQSGDTHPVPARKLKKLYAGDAVLCECNSSLTLGLITGADQSVRMQLAAGDDCFRVPQLATPPAVKGHTTPGTRTDAELTVDYGDPGGPSRGQMVPIYSPSPDAAAEPADFTVRWSSPRLEKALRLSVWNEEGVKIWPATDSEGQVDAKLGELASASLREALKRYRQQGGAGTPELRVEDASGHTYRIRFSLLSQHSEEVLEQELVQCMASEKDVFLPLCRAAAFRRFKMYPEMAAAYDLAVTLAPDSADLLQNAIEVNERTGNTQRVEELKAALDKLNRPQ